MHDTRPGWDPALVDGLVVVVVAAVGLFGLLVPRLGDEVAIGVAPVVLVLAQAVVLWWRRRRPLAVLVVTLGALLVAQAIGDANSASFMGPHAAAYAVAAYGGRTAALSGLGLLVVVALLDAGVIRWVDVGYDAVLVGPTGVLAAVAWGAGRYVEVRRAYLRAVLAYNHQLERDRDEEARRAVREERRRIARELHDQVAHHLGVISLHVSAAQRWLERDPSRTAAALASAEQASRAALETMPMILQALRSGDGDTSRDPQPTLDDLDALLARVRDTGLAVDLFVEGEPRPVPARVGLTGYRVIQEALTNVLKHAGPATVAVRLRYAPDRLEIDVHDDGHGLAAGTSDGGGFGLAGMHERVELLDGVLTTGPREGGGFTVHAALPTTTRVVAQ